MQNSTAITKRIDSFQSLRALAFLGIFLCHSGMAFGWPELGVSIFFILSGFLMQSKYGEKEIKISIKNSVAFSWNRIKKLYPLHIITMIFAVMLDTIVYMQRGDVELLRFGKRMIGTIILNITLTQTWVPNRDINMSLNGVAWYLSVTMFLYFMFPFIKGFVSKTDSKKLTRMIIFTVTVGLLLCFPVIYLFGIKSAITRWFYYCFPIFRAGDFFVGCCMSKIYYSRKREISSKFLANIIEIAVFLLAVIVSVWNNQRFEYKSKISEIIVGSLKNPTTFSIIGGCLIVFIFVENKGTLTKALTNKFLISLGNISSYAFLIHFVITEYTCEFYDYSAEDPIRKIMIVSLELIVSIILSIAYQKKLNTKKD